MSSRFLLLLTMAFAAILSIMYGGERLFLWMAYLAAAVFIIALLNIAHSLLFIRITQTVYPVERTSGEYGTLVIRISNRGIFPLTHIDLWLDNSETILQRGRAKKSMLPRAACGYAPVIMPGKTEIFNEEIFFPYRGHFEPGVLHAELRDVFGLWHIKLPASFYKGAQVVAVLPRDSSAALGQLDDNSLSGEASGGRGEPEPYSIAGIRRFYPGDPLKRVHWKLSARAGELLVKEFDVVHLPSVLVFLDLSPHGLEGEYAAALEDCMCRNAAAACSAALHSRTPLVLIAYEGERGEATGNSPGDLLYIRRFLSQVLFTSPYPFHEIIRLEIGRQPKVSHVAVVTTMAPPPLTEYLASLSAQGCGVTLVTIAKDFGGGNAVSPEAGAKSEAPDGRGLTLVADYPEILHRPPAAQTGEAAGEGAAKPQAQGKGGGKHA